MGRSGSRMTENAFWIRLHSIGNERQLIECNEAPVRNRHVEHPVDPGCDTHLQGSCEGHELNQ